MLTTTSGPGRLRAAACGQRATAGLLEEIFAELDDAQVDPATTPAGLSERGREVMDLHRLYRARVTDLLAPAELFDLAAEIVAAGDGPQSPVILVAAGPLTAVEKRLFAALRAAGRLSAVLPAVCNGDTAGWLSSQFPSIAPADAPELPTVVRLLVAPDAEEEVRIAIRTTLDQLAGTSCRPERIGIGYRTATPYARLLAEQLTVAGIPHHVPSQRTLAQTVAGRTVSGVLSLFERGFPRPDVLRWLADAPVLDGAGRKVPAAWWERLSQEAGVSRGLETWRLRLNRYAADQRQRAAESAGGDDEREGYEGRASSALVLLAEVENLDAVAGAVLTATSWPAVSDHLLALLRRALGPRRRVDGWSAGASVELARPIALEQAAYDEVTTLLRSLSTLDTPVDPEAVLAALADGLAASVPSGTTLGRGVLVGTLRSFTGADLDLLLVLGATEDALPARQRESPVLRDADRALLSPELATVASRRTAERESWAAALASAQAVHVSYPRADTRSQRRQFPSPWYLEQAQRLDTRFDAKPISAAQVDAGDIDAPWFTFYASFDAALRQADTFASAQELDIVYALHGSVDDLAADDARLKRGLDAARSRALGEFNEWAGNTGTLPEVLRSQVDAHLSATALQTWATCPASHLYGKVLGVRDLEDRARDDTIDARRKGTLVHEVLADLIGDHTGTVQTPGIAPDVAWSTADLDRAVALLESKAAVLTERGLTGREVPWIAQLARLRRALVRVLAVDSVQRRRRRSWPIGVEAPFGRSDAMDLVLDLPTQRQVRFAGSIDRIDATENGGLVVVDYKTGAGYGYEGIPTAAKPDASADLHDRGRKLQLLLYSLAARQLEELPDAEVEAWFWFVELGDLHRGGPVDAAREQGLKDVLDLVVGGIRGGMYPANPGKEGWRASKSTWENCSFCPYDRVCPTTRVELWDSQRRHPAARPYADLVDPPEVPA